MPPSDPAPLAAITSIEDLIGRCMASAAAGEVDLALGVLDKIIAVHPAHRMARIERGRLRFKAGQIAGAVEDFEYFYKGRLPSQIGIFLGPDGALARQDGVRVVIANDSGLGDLIHMARYGVLLHDLGAEVSVECEPVFHDLLRNAPWVARVVGKGQIDFPFDHRIPLHWLFGACGTTLDSFPAYRRYLSPSPAKVAAWASLLPPGRRLRVGICWRSANEGSAIWTSHRGVALAALLDALDDARVEIVCLQKDLTEAEAACLAARSGARVAGPLFSTFDDTGAAMMSLDLVVSTCTVVPHLAGALGVPTVLLLSTNADWRWLTSGRRTAWYPSMTLLRQEQLGDWAPVLAALPGELDRLASASGAVAPLPDK